MKRVSLKSYLFGTWDRVYTFLSLVFSALGIILTIILWKFPQSIPELIICRDIIILVGLVAALTVVIVRYFSKEKALLAEIDTKDHIISNLLGQFEHSHKIIHNFRDICFSNLKHGLDFSQKGNISEQDRKCFKRICHSVTTELIHSLSRYFQSQNKEIDSTDISVALKLVVSGNEISEFENGLHGDDLSLFKKRFSNVHRSKDYLLTVYRDPQTYENDKGREVFQIAYDIEKNTAFSNILINHKSHFLCNDLSALGPNYLNQNPNRQYNSTLVVPIRFLNATNPIYFGLVAVDSKNERKFDLYNDKECMNILGHTADLLAVYFLMIEINKSTNGGTCIA